MTISVDIFVYNKTPVNVKQMILKEGGKVLKMSSDDSIYNINFFFPDNDSFDSFLESINNSIHNQEC